MKADSVEDHDGTGAEISPVFGQGIFKLKASLTVGGVNRKKCQTFIISTSIPHE